MEEKRFFKRAQQPRDSRVGRLEQVHLTLQLCLDLLERQSLCSQLAHAAKLGQRAKVVDRLAGLGSRRRRDDALFGPAANQPFAQTEQLFDVLNGVGRLDPLVICLRRRRGGEPQNLGVLLGHLVKLSRWLTKPCSCEPSSALLPPLLPASLPASWSCLWL